MAKPPRLVLEAYEELILEPKQYVKYRLQRTSRMAWLIFPTLSSIFSNFAL